MSLENPTTPPATPTQSRIGRALSRHKKKIIGILGAIGIAAGTVPYMKNEQRLVDERHDFLNAEFSLESLDTKRLAQEVVFTTLYPGLPLELGEIRGRSHKVPLLRNLIRRVPKSGGILLRYPDMQSIEQIREVTALIRSENPTAVIAVDFEGGYIRFPNLSAEHKEKYRFPEAIFSIREKESRTYVSNEASQKRLGQFPSAEFLGKEFEALKKGEEQEQFLDMMESYGNSMGLLLSDIGVHLIL